MLDNELLTAIFRQAMGSGSNLASEPNENIDPGGGAILPFLLSFWLSGGRIAFVYEVNSNCLLFCCKPSSDASFATEKNNIRWFHQTKLLPMKQNHQMVSSDRAS